MTFVPTEKGKVMSDMAMKYEDWLRGCVHHDGRKGNVYLPCDMVLAIADWIEAHRDVAPVRHGHWIKISPAGIYECSECGKNVMTSDIEAYVWCHGCGARMDGEDNEID